MRVLYHSPDHSEVATVTAFVVQVVLGVALVMTTHRFISRMLLLSNSPDRHQRGVLSLTRHPAYFIMAFPPVVIIAGMTALDLFTPSTGRGLLLAYSLTAFPAINYQLDCISGLSLRLLPLALKVRLRWGPLCLGALTVWMLAVNQQFELAICVGFVLWLGYRLFRDAGAAWRLLMLERKRLDSQMMQIDLVVGRFMADVLRAEAALQQVPNAASAAPIVMMGEHGPRLLGHQFTTTSGMTGWQFLDPTFGSLATQDQSPPSNPD